MGSKGPCLTGSSWSRSLARSRIETSVGPHAASPSGNSSRARQGAFCGGTRGTGFRDAAASAVASRMLQALGRREHYRTLSHRRLRTKQAQAGDTRTIHDREVRSSSGAISDALQRQQEHLADRCEICSGGSPASASLRLLTKLRALNATRQKDHWRAILEAFVAKELQPWVKTFPAEYYAQLFRLRGLDYSPSSVKRPQYFGTLTNDIIWKRLAPGVLTN